MSKETKFDFQAIKAISSLTVGYLNSGKRAWQTRATLTFNSAMNAVCTLEVTLPDDSKTAEVGSTIQASCDLSLSAAQDVNLRAATVQSEAALTVNATRELNITAGQSTLNNDSTSFSSFSDWLSSSTSQSRNTVNRVDAVSSELGGQTVTPIRREPAPKRLAPRTAAAPHPHTKMVHTARRAPP